MEHARQVLKKIGHELSLTITLPTEKNPGEAHNWNHAATQLQTVGLCFQDRLRKASNRLSRVEGIPATNTYKHHIPFSLFLPTSSFQRSFPASLDDSILEDFLILGIHVELASKLVLPSRALWFTDAIGSAWTEGGTVTAMATAMKALPIAQFSLLGRCMWEDRLKM